MKVTVHPSHIQGQVRVPASKSSMQRALAAALLFHGKTTLLNPGHSNDDKAAIGIIRDLGAAVEISKQQVIIDSTGVFPGNQEINCGESGLAIRMFTPIISTSDSRVSISGEGSLLTRPMDFFDKILPQLSVKIKSSDGKLPMSIQGPLRPANVEVDGSLSSQFLTGLLMAYAGAGASGVSIKVKNLKSKPYIDLTLQVITHFGLGNIENRNYEEFYFHPADKKQGTIVYTVEGDWSGAAFLLVAGAIAGSIKVGGLDITSTQADKVIIDVLMSANAGIAIDAKGINIHPAEMTAFDFDATDCPDLFPPLVALAAYCKGDTVIKGISRLTHKESNRAITLQEEFGKMGVQIELIDDTMVIRGGGQLKGTVVHSRHDHRIAMGCTVAALRAAGDTIIEEAGAVQKSYPDFYKDLKSLGASLSLPYQNYNL